MATSWKNEVYVEREWTTNQMRFANKEQAEGYGRNLRGRWTLVDDIRAVETTDPVNYAWDDRLGLVPVAAIPLEAAVPLKAATPAEAAAPAKAPAGLRKGWHPSITMNRLNTLVRKDENAGICLACGKRKNNVEPDACGYRCDSCREAKVYGAEQLLIMAV